MKQFLTREANKGTREITEQNSKIPPQISEIRNIHVCVETGGYGNKKLEEMLKYKLKSSLY